MVPISDEELSVQSWMVFWQIMLIKSAEISLTYLINLGYYYAIITAYETYFSDVAIEKMWSAVLLGINL